MKKYYLLIIVALILGLVLTGCSLLSNIGQAPATEQSGITYLTKGGPTVDDADSFPLYAGQDWLVGEVLVWDDGTQLCVKYVLDPGIFAEGWGITETHLAVGHVVGDIPQTKKGNPIPGQFLYGDDELEGEDSWEICIPFDELSKEEPGDLAPIVGGETLVIAAHAVIEKEECIPGDSGTDTYVSDATTMVTEGNVVSAVYPYVAVPTDAGPYYGVNTWINQTNSNIWAPGALWIWESNPVVKPILGDIVWFEKTFNVTGTPTAGELKIAVDNGYAVWLNGKFVGSDNLLQFVGADDVYDTATLGDLKQAYVDTTTWQEVGMFDLTPYLQTGTNTLKILGVNEYMNPDDGGQPVGTDLLNPGGMAFQFTVDWEVPEVCTTTDDETAWGAADGQGNEQFDGANWATYFEYIVQPPVVAPVATPGDPGLTQAAGVRYRGNSSGNEIYLGIADLGVGGNRVEVSYPNVYANWQDGTYAVTFAFDQTENKITTSIDNGLGDSTSLEYDFDLLLSPGCLPANWDTLDILVLDRLTTGAMAFNNVMLNSFSLGDLGTIDVSGVPGWQHWTVTGFDFSQSFTITGELVVAGWTGSETNKLQILVGCLP